MPGFLAQVVTAKLYDGQRLYHSPTCREQVTARRAAGRKALCLRVLFRLYLKAFSLYDTHTEKSLAMDI